MFSTNTQATERCSHPGYLPWTKRTYQVMGMVCVHDFFQSSKLQTLRRNFLSVMLQRV